jgi:hypothetical protein
MNKKNFFISLVLVISILITQVGTVFAAPALQAFSPITGTVQSITLETHPNTGITTAVVEVVSENQAGQTLQTVRISQKTAEQLGVVVLDGDAKPVINDFALGKLIEIDPTTIIPEQEETQHPAGSALATFFSNVEGLDYDTIMAAHAEGFGFGVIAQALWLTRQMEGNADDFLKLLLAKQTGDYSEFDEYLIENGTSPTNWGQLRKAILQNKKNNSAIVISNQNNNGNGNHKDKNKDKDKDKSNNGNGNGNGNGRNR